MTRRKRLVRLPATCVPEAVAQQIDELVERRCSTTGYASRAGIQRELLIEAVAREFAQRRSDNTIEVRHA